MNIDESKGQLQAIDILIFRSFSPYLNTIIPKSRTSPYPKQKVKWMYLFTCPCYCNRNSIYAEFILGKIDVDSNLLSLILKLQM